MSVDMKFEGGLDIERALADLSRSTAKNVARRALRKELKPVADIANALWPGSADDVFRLGSRVVASQPSPRKGRATINLFVGAPGGANGTPEAHLIEFGTGPRFQSTTGRYTGSVAASPMLQPAWDMRKGRMLRGLGESLWAEISKTIERRAKRAGR